MRQYFLSKITAYRPLDSDLYDLKYENKNYEIIINNDEEEFNLFFWIEIYNVIMNLYATYQEEYWDLKNKDLNFALGKIKYNLIKNIITSNKNEKNNFYLLTSNDNIFNYFNCVNLYFFLNFPFKIKNNISQEQFLNELFYPLSLDKLKLISHLQFQKLFDYVLFKEETIQYFQTKYLENVILHLKNDNNNLNSAYLLKNNIDNDKNQINLYKLFPNLLNFLQNNNKKINDLELFILSYSLYKNNYYPNIFDENKIPKEIILNVDNIFKILIKKLIDELNIINNNSLLNFYLQEKFIDIDKILFYKNQFELLNSKNIKIF